MGLLLWKAVSQPGAERHVWRRTLTSGQKFTTKSGSSANGTVQSANVYGVAKDPTTFAPKKSAVGFDAVDPWLGCKVGESMCPAGDPDHLTIVQQPDLCEGG